MLDEFCGGLGDFVLPYAVYSSSQTESHVFDDSMVSTDADPSLNCPSSYEFTVVMADESPLVS